MRKDYKNPPLVEALCEFQFIPGQAWDSTVPGIFYKEIQTDYPERQEQVGIGFQVQQTEIGFEQRIVPAPPKVQFFSIDRKRLVQLSPDLLAVNCLKPYPSWKEFKPMIIKNLEAYKKVANPKGFRRVGLRYINVFQFNDLNLKLEDFFHYYPHIPKNLPQKSNSFFCRVEIPYDSEQLILTMGTTVPEKPDLLQITLDIDYAMVIPEKISFSDISKWLDKAHKAVESAFESCISDKARELFQGGE